MEVDSSKEAEFGVQWQNIIGKTGGNIGVLGTNFGSSNNLLSISTSNGKTLPGNGLNIGLGQNINGRNVMTALANFLQSDGSSNILSRPTLLTLDNEEAKIVVGQNVPFVTGQYTNNNSGGTGAVNPFQTIERKDVGLTLKVKPQISENGTVKLTIFQEVSSVQASSVNSASGLITNKRSIESNIVVADGGSTDGTVETVQRMIASRPGLAFLHNPKRIQSAAVDLGWPVVEVDASGTPDEVLALALAAVRGAGACSARTPPPRCPRSSRGTAAATVGTSSRWAARCRAATRWNGTTCATTSTPRT